MENLTPLLSVFGASVTPVTDIAVRPVLADLKERAHEALAEMRADIQAAKSGIPGLVGYDFDISDPAAVRKAKQDFKESLSVHIIDGPSQAHVIERMYDLYAKTFPIEEEREDLDKLLMVLERNHHIAEKDLARQHWIVLETPQGDIIGGRYTSSFALAPLSRPHPTVTPVTPAMTAQFDGTQHLTYGFVDSRYRAMGLGEYTMDLAENIGREFIAAATGIKPTSVDMLKFCEQNDPLRMHVDAMLKDIIGSRTDPFWRRDYYQKLGFREVDCEYVQLPLRSPERGGEPCEILKLLVKPSYGHASLRTSRAELDRLDADLVKFHIYNVFEHSFAAGQYDVLKNDRWKSQSAKLRGTLEVLPPIDFEKTKERAWWFIDYALNFSQKEGAGSESLLLGDIMNMRKMPLLGL